MIFSKIKRRFRFFITRIDSAFNGLFLRLNGVKIGGGLKARGRILVHNLGEIEMGNFVTINSSLWSNPISASARTCIQIMDGGKLVIGNNVGISNSAITCARKVTIGNNVMIGAACQIFDTVFHPIDARWRYGSERDNSKTGTSEVVIEDGVFIGTNSIILKGAHIGRNSVIGAGSVVAGNIPEYEIWAGRPARYIKSIAHDE